jgi:thiol-disulfide isomerase/thioredoxin
MNKISKPSVRAFLLGFGAILLFLAVSRIISAIHPRHYHFLGVEWDGYLLLALVLTLSIMVAKFSDRRVWLHGLLAGIGFGLPLYVSALYTMSPDPRKWVWLLGWPMFGIYVALVSVLLITSLWAQGADLWLKRRRLSAALVLVGSAALVIAIWAAGFALMRFHFARSQAMQSSTATQQIDMPLPNLALTAMDGRPISANELQGHITVIDFWGTWCGACIAEFPSLEAVHKEYSGNPRVRFLLVNPEIEGDTPEKINRFLQRSPLSIPVALDPEGPYFELSQKLNNNGLPLRIVIDRSGHIRFREYGFASADKTRHELHAEIDTLLAAP